MFVCGDWRSLKVFGRLDVFFIASTFSRMFALVSQLPDCCFRLTHIATNRMYFDGGMLWFLEPHSCLSSLVKGCVRVVFVCWSVLLFLLFVSLKWYALWDGFLFIAFAASNGFVQYKNLGKYIVLYLTCPYRLECSKIYVLFWLVKFINCCMLFCKCFFVSFFFIIVVDFCVDENSFWV